jgi:hypothetical protein
MINKFVAVVYEQEGDGGSIESKDLNWIIETLPENKMVDLGVFYTDQCNFSLSPEQLRTLFYKTIHLNISCYREVVSGRNKT